MPLTKAEKSPTQFIIQNQYGLTLSYIHHKKSSYRAYFSYEIVYSIHCFIYSPPDFESVLLKLGLIVDESFFFTFRGF